MAVRGNMSELDSNLQILQNMLRGHTDSDMTENVAELAQNISEHCADDEELKQRVCGIMLECITMENDIKQHISALNHIKSLNPDSTNLVDLLENKLTDLRQSEGDPLQHPKYLELVEKMSHAQEDEESQLASLKATLLGRSQDDEIEMTEGEVNIKCPYSGQIMVTPMINTRCNHVYDRDAIMEYIKTRKNRAKCPVGGCGNSAPIQTSHLKEHKDLKKFIKLVTKQH